MKENIVRHVFTICLKNAEHSHVSDSVLIPAAAFTDLLVCLSPSGLTVQHVQRSPRFPSDSL